VVVIAEERVDLVAVVAVSLSLGREALVRVEDDGVMLERLVKVEDVREADVVEEPRNAGIRR
jgi:hypothetical protein